MYTLEDDQETSASLRKRDFVNSPDAQAPSDTGGAAGEAPGDAPQQTGSSFVRPFSPRQITSSFKRLTTPGKNAAAVGSGGKRVALAALTVACIGVFFTALGQALGVSAL